MADILHFLRNYPERSKHTWYLSGSERRGVEIVVDMIRDMVEPSSTEFYVFHLKDDRFADVLDALYLVSGVPRLVVIRDVEILSDLKRWDKLLRIALHPETTYTVFVDGTDNPRKGKVPEVFRWIAKIGRFIEVRPISDEKLLELVTLMTDLSEIKAKRLLKQLGSSLDTVFTELWKFNLARLNIGDVILFEQELQFDPLACLFNKPYRHPGYNARQILGLVELDLVRQAAVYDALRDGHRAFEIALMFDIPKFAIYDIIGRSKRVDPLILAIRLSLVNRAQNFLRLHADEVYVMDWFFSNWRRI